MVTSAINFYRKRHPLWLVGLAMLFLPLVIVSFQQVQEIRSQAAETQLSVTVFLHGIGNGGDSLNIKSIGNTTPQTRQKNISLSILNGQNQVVATKDMQASYDSATGSYKGTASFAGLTSGTYRVSLKTDRYLRKVVSGIQTISSGQINQVAPIYLITGDINGDNQINILDHNLLMGCYSDLLAAKSCTSVQKTMADVTDDGNVNQQDYNLFVRELGNRQGEELPPVVVEPTKAVSSDIFERPFPDTSAFYTPIPQNPVIDPLSAQYVAANFASNTVSFVNAYEGARTIYKSTASDPVYNVTFTYDPSWGPNPFNQTVTASKGTGKCNPLHIPDRATKPGNHDRWMLIYDTTKPGLLCEIWEADKSTGTWKGSYGGVFDVYGDGTKPIAGFGTGSSIAAISLVIRTSDVKSGVINHALVFPAYCNSAKYRSPARNSDGRCTSPSMPLEAGMRLQLDPAFDCKTVPAGIKRMVCVALQTYGAYNGDIAASGGVTQYVGFMMETDDPTDPNRKPWQTPGDYTRSGGLYNQLGITTDFTKMPEIPMNRMRILRTWQGN